MGTINSKNDQPKLYTTWIANNKIGHITSWGWIDETLETKNDC